MRPYTVTRTSLSQESIMSIAPYFVLIAIVAVGVIEVIAFTVMKDDVHLPARRVQPE